MNSSNGDIEIRCVGFQKVIILIIFFGFPLYVIVDQTRAYPLHIEATIIFDLVMTSVIFFGLYLLNLVVTLSEKFISQQSLRPFAKKTIYFDDVTRLISGTVGGRTGGKMSIYSKSEKITIPGIAFGLSQLAQIEKYVLSKSSQLKDQKPFLLSYMRKERKETVYIVSTKVHYKKEDNDRDPNSTN